MLIGIIWLLLCLIPFFYYDQIEAFLGTSNRSKSKSSQNRVFVTISDGSSDESDLFTYSFDTDSTVTITRYIGTSSTVTIPASAFDKSVTKISTGAFSLCPMLQRVILPESITTISSAAFSRCILLKDVYLPSSLKTIDSFAFPNGCRATFHVTPNSVGEQYCKTKGFKFTYN